MRGRMFLKRHCPLKEHFVPGIEQPIREMGGNPFTALLVGGEYCQRKQLHWEQCQLTYINKRFTHQK